MTVWIHAIEDGGFEQVATVENGEVVEGDETIVAQAFPDGIPDDEEEVARAFLEPPTVASTDFEMDFNEPEEELTLGGGNFFRCLGGIEREVIQSAPEFDQPLLELHQRLWDADVDTRLLDIPTGSATPAFVKDHIREAIMGGAIFSDFDSVPSGELMQLREYMTETLESDGWTIDGLADQLEQLPGVDPSNARTIARTETASVLNTAREDAYEDQGQEDDLFYWSGSLDNRTTDACRWLINGADTDFDGTNPFEGGDPVPLDELKDLIEEAPTHDPDMDNNLARPGNFVVHPSERKTFVRHVG